MSETYLILVLLLFAALVAAALWAFAYYAFYAVRSQFLGETIWHGTTNDNTVALTFDDGPSPDTEDLLDVLKAANVKATFFLIGNNVEKYPETARRIRRENHEIGNHSFSHPIYLFRSPERVRRELEETQEIIFETIGVRPKIARPPCGVRSRAYFKAARDLDLQTVQWSDTGYDWENLDASQIARRVLDTVQSRSIVLLHDGDSRGKADRHATIESIPLILEGLKKKNLRIAPLAEMIAGNSQAKKNFLMEKIS